MNLREIVEVIGLPIVDLSRQSGVSRFRLYSFLHGDLSLAESEQKAIAGVLLQQASRVQQAASVLREVARA